VVPFSPDFWSLDWDLGERSKIQNVKKSKAINEFSLTKFESQSQRFSNRE
jgi:hypothetical protein